MPQSPQISHAMSRSTLLWAWFLLTSILKLFKYPETFQDWWILSSPLPTTGSDDDVIYWKLILSVVESLRMPILVLPESSAEKLGRGYFLSAA